MVALDLPDTDETLWEPEEEIAEQATVKGPLAPDVWLDQLTDDFIAKTVERQETKRRAQYREMTLWEIEAEGEYLVAERGYLWTAFFSGELGDDGYQIVLDGWEARTDWLLDELRRREIETGYRSDPRYRAPGRFTKDWMQDIKRRVDGQAVAEFIARYHTGTLLKREGDRYVGLCPFHSEKTPSFMIYPSGRWVCFGACHEGGDLFAYLQKAGLRWKDAVLAVASYLGVTVPDVAVEPARSGPRPIWEKYDA